MARATSGLRLAAAAWSLIRADALLPREIAALAPWPWRQAAGALRLAARRSDAPPGARLAATLERLGPVAIKFGQFLSTRGDIIGAHAAADLGRLKDALAPFDTGEARAAAEAALGVPLAKVFAEFGEPVAAASLAQAHRARLADGREVAVKVLRPGIERRVAADIAALELAARLVEALFPPARRLAPRAFAATVARALALELDLRFEAAGADELRQAMAADGYMEGPKVVWEGVAQRVLTLEWAQGAPLSDPRALLAKGLDRPATARNLVRGFLAQALDHGVFHADLHEGNLFVAAPARLTAIDFGIIGRLDRGQRRFLAEILWGFLTRDYARVAAAHFAAGYVPAHHDQPAFAQALRAVGEPVVGRRADEVEMSRLLTQLFDITALFDMRLRPELVLLQKTMVTVEGVARRIDPAIDIWQAAEPVVRRWIGRELNPATRVKELAQAARSAIEGLAADILSGPAPASAEERRPRRGWPAFVLLLALAVGSAAGAALAILASR